MIKLTERQHAHLNMIAAGHDTIQCIAEELGASRHAVSRRLGELRDMRLIESRWVSSDDGRIYKHSLTARYNTMVRMGYTTKAFDKKPITEANLYYAAILTNGGFTGLDRLTQYQKVFPDRSLGSLKNILRLAGRMHIIRR